ncbi:MAG: lipopolysaccharide/colanic/teichoic acid biosynthesis glycosyltransferase [Pirellulaceae bacterium]|jgi:lipopolysaccharide/colanic/teichoic acid biosynthesis glycosyltransferase/GGDEF domain-containing protein
MVIRKLINRLAGSAKKLPDQEAFQRTLHKERVRAERTNSGFSLIVFHIPATQELVDLLRERVRLTDEVGMLEDRIAVILPDTEVEGAETLAEEVTRQTHAPITAPAFAIYIYPDVPTDDELSKSIQDHENKRSENKRSENKRSENATSENATSENAPVASSAMKAQPLDMLFIQPLPLWKRALDIIGAACGLIATSPILLIAAIAIKATSHGPILFSQQRRGIGGRAFKIFKFRTMVIDAEAQKAKLRAQSEQDGPAFKMKHDPRITSLGHFLRKSCIDELPQLWNVLIGDMSLVGPRPLPCDEADQCQSWERRRMHVTPGLTCIWQVDGGSHVTFADWMRMDIRYINGRTFGMDVSLLFRTFWEVLMHRASQ